MWFADNSGYLTCLDTTTMTPLWVRDCSDDTDASTVLEEDGENLWLYVSSEIDKQGTHGTCYLRKLNALTGELVWEQTLTGGDSGHEAGAYATPALGKGSLKGLIFYAIAKTDKYGGGVLLGVDSATGDILWTVKLSRSSWSSPTCIYDENGNGWVVHADGGGVLRLVDGHTGEVLAKADLESNVEGSPAIFGDMLVVGTRGRKIFGVKIG